MIVANESADVLPLDFEDAVSEFITHMKTAHNVTPVLPEPEYSRLDGSTWQLRNEHGLLARVGCDRVVS